MAKLLDFLQKVKGTRDVMDIEYNAIDENTRTEQVDFTGVRGSVRFADPTKVVMPKEANEMIDAYLAAPLA